MPQQTTSPNASETQQQEQNCTAEPSSESGPALTTHPHLLEPWEQLVPARVSSAEENAHLGPPPFLSEAAESFPDALPDRKIYPSILFCIPQISPTYWAYRWVL